MKVLDPYRVKPHTKVSLTKQKTNQDGGLSREIVLEKTEQLLKRFVQLQELLYAEKKHALLIVLQAMDTGGKDSTIRKIFSGVNPQGCVVTSFKEPTPLELSHDFLWRCHQNVPSKGFIGIFNRSYYEDVLAVRVKNLVPKKLWQRRYEHINNFERLLHDEGTTICKFYLHISKDYQKERLQLRLATPEKRWKFNINDILTRKQWHSYQDAYEAVLNHCSTKEAPWYVIPAENHWYRDYLIAQILVDKLESLKMNYPQISFDPKKIRFK